MMMSKALLMIERYFSHNITTQKILCKRLQRRKTVVQKKKKEMKTDQRKNSSAVAISSRLYSILLISISYILLSLIRPKDSWTLTKESRLIH